MLLNLYIQDCRW